jgi:hypothetical protein
MVSELRTTGSSWLFVIDATPPANGRLVVVQEVLVNTDTTARLNLTGMRSFLRSYQDLRTQPATLAKGGGPMICYILLDTILVTTFYIYHQHG